MGGRRSFGRRPLGVEQTRLGHHAAATAFLREAFFEPPFLAVFFFAAFFAAGFLAAFFLLAFFAAGFLAAFFFAAFFPAPFFEVRFFFEDFFFADFISALEQPQERRRLTLVSDPINDAPKLLVEGRHLPIPPNVWFVGTANHDESTAEFADKTYDRALVMEMPRKTEEAQFVIEDKRARPAMSFSALEK